MQKKNPTRGFLSFLVIAKEWEGDNKKKAYASTLCLYGFLFFGRFFLCPSLHFGSFFTSHLLGLRLFSHFLEAINTTSSVDSLFLSGVEWVTQSADFSVHRFYCRTGFKHGTAGARNSRLCEVFWMNALFHKFSLKIDRVIFRSNVVESLAQGAEIGKHP